MSSKRLRISVMSLALLILSWAGQPVGAGQVETTAQAKADETGKLYTAYNLWFEKPTKMFAINYRRGTLLPAGTELASVDIGGVGSRKPFLTLITATGGTYGIYLRPKFHPGLSIQQFKDRLVTDKPIEQLTQGLAEKEIDAIREGKLVVGMSKQAVLIARGYPPSHRTPSIDANAWLYWENRFRKKLVHFDKDNRTTRTAAAKDEL